MAEKPAEHWYERAADAIVRDGQTLFNFANHADLGLTSKECDSIQKTKAFQEILRARRNIYHKELVQDPTFTRASVEGQLVLAINKLMENHAYDKAATAIMQFAKLKGWTTEQTSINILNDLTSGDIQKMKEKLRDKMAGQPVH